MSQRVRIHTSIVDFQEHTISREGVVLQVQGKVLQVLTCLMAQQGQLVSIDTLMLEVWGQTVVSPNTLQRCIAQLRKAFGETSQTQNVIKTYPKRGYALIVPVVTEADDFRSPITAPDDNRQAALSPLKSGKTTKSTKTAKTTRWLVGITTVALALFIIAFQTPLPTPVMLQLQSQITASDLHEDNASYSPDQRFIAFERFSSFCSSTFWLQQRSDKSELQLTHVPQQFSGSAWSSDATQLAMISSNHCVAPDHSQCWQVQLIELVALLKDKTPATFNKLGACEHQQLSHPVWQDYQQLLMLRQTKNTGRRTLVQMSVSDGQLKELLSEGDILTFTQLPNQQLLAISHAGNGQSELLKVSLHGEILSRVAIQYRQHTSAFNQVRLSYLTDTNQLILESDGQLFTLLQDGTIKPVPVPSSLRLSRFAFAGKNAVASMGGIDLDIISSNPKGTNLQTLQRSPAFESQAKLSPAGTSKQQNMVFVSDRSGQNQIWLAEGSWPAKGSVLRQLSTFGTSVKINGLVWAADGHSVLAVVNDLLYQFALDGQMSQLNSPVRIKYLHQATAEGLLLLEYQHEFQEMLALYQPTTGTLEPIQHGNFDDARLDQYGTLWFSDASFNLYQLPKNQNVVKAVLPEFKLSAFTIEGENLLATTKSGELLQVDLQLQKTQLVALPKDRNLWISDASAEQILFNQKQTISTDIMEFSW
ncbi:hypothetical protein A5320_10090 [Rheinheimera sp. SA_1]|uniref:winged helix-turn-helix domain-containing protein n=1 Tax=Rheinheimera sp. SA_1 TaxID=1827365 RepID=UPI0008020942|nr:winged helix-turn-helix domain-containing protein [Rheinheimera sp. SA_1]OBP15655.1 hypothetical protein A5320_10090 [Rheinheimera sp. SA_1]